MSSLYRCICFSGRPGRPSLRFRWNVSWVLLVSLLFSAVGVQAKIGVAYQMQLGNPSSATQTPSNHVHYLIQRAQYAMDYNDTMRVPNWVSWDLTTEDVGGSGRSSFTTDPDLPAGFTVVGTGDYSGSGYDRGHMCPSADRTVDTANNKILFYMTNMVPQAPDNNQGVWANFESDCRSIAAQGNELLITCGPSKYSGSKIASGVAIPGFVWKIVLVVPTGAGEAISRVTTATRVIAISIPNIAGVRSDPWTKYLTSIAQIEADTGYSFLTALPSTVASALRSKVDGQTPTNLPSITGQPTPQTTALGGSASFAVTATGTGTLAYQWFKDDEAITDATSPTLTLTNVQASDAGNYEVVVANANGSATSASVALVVTGLPPVIASAPAARTVNAGDAATFAVTVTGTSPFTYTWRKGGTPIVGNASAGTAALTLPNAQAADVGAYDVIVANNVSTRTSTAAALTVLPAAPIITTQPSARTVAPGGTATFSVVAKGTEPFTYQWRKGGTAITGNASATTASLVLSSVQTADAVSYDVIVTGPQGNVTSTTAALTVSTSTTSVIAWDFATATPKTALPANLSNGAVTQGNNNGTTTMLTASSVSSGYTGVSGSNNAGAAARIGALSKASAGSAYFEFTLTAASGYRLRATALSFGSRSTGTGPKAYDVYTSADNYATRVATGTFVSDSKWVLHSPTLTEVQGAAGAGVTFRIYGYNGSGSAQANTANWRIDDLQLTVSVDAPSSVPAVSSTIPAKNATGVAASSPLTVTFNQPVTVGDGWFTLASAASGPLTATVTGGPTTFTLTPPTNFAIADTITLTIKAGKVVDLATQAQSLASDYGVSFTTAAPVAPTIATQPQNQSGTAGSNVTYTVTANGSAPFTYQWRKGGAAITTNTTATSAALTLTNIEAADAGSYDVVVTNSAGTVTSSAATLSVTATATDQVRWDFTTAAPTSALPAHLSGGTVTQGNNNGTTTLLTEVSVSGTAYTGASSGNNAGAAARIGALSQAAGGSAYFEFMLVPQSGYKVHATGLAFGSRSTKTGPQAYAIYTSADGYAAPVASGTFVNDSVWAWHTPALAGVTGANGVAVSFRLYGFNGTGSPATSTANWRIDDLRLTVSADAAFTPVELWRQAQFGAVANSGVGADGADPDGDGLVNQLEYALGQDPNAAGSAARPVGRLEGGDFVFRYTRPTAVTDVTYTVESSTDLVNWSAVSPTVEATGASTQTLVARLAPTQAKQFVRLNTGAAATIPVGYVNVTLAGNGATTAFGLSLDDPDAPLTGLRAGKVEAVSATTLTCTAGGWSGNLGNAAAPWGVRLTSGAAAGRLLDIKANTATTLTVGSTAGVAPGDTFELVPIDTLATLFGSGALQGGTTAAAADQVQFLAAAWTGYYYNTTSGFWRPASGPAINYNNTKLRFGTGVQTIRRAAALGVVFTGRVLGTAFVTPVANAGVTVLTTGYPVDTTLGAFAIQTRLSGWRSGTTTAADQVLLHDGTAWIAYVYNGTSWQIAGDPTNRNSIPIPGGALLLVQRPGTTSGTTNLTYPRPY